MIEGARLRGRMQIQPRRRRVDIPAVAFRLAQQLRITYLSTSRDHTAGSIVEKFPALPGVDRFCVGVNCPSRPLLWFRLAWLHPLRAAKFVRLKCRVNALVDLQLEAVVEVTILDVGTQRTGRLLEAWWHCVRCSCDFQDACLAAK